jgi:MAF protein
MTTSLLLASGSPRRRQLITRLGLPVTFCTPPADEDAAQQRYLGPSDNLAVWLAKHKLSSVLNLPEAAERMIIAADTTVLLNDVLLGKPRDEQHARELLLSLRGRWHHVVTGIAVSYFIDGKRQMRSGSSVTPVLMRRYSEKEIAAYVATGDPLDKAGAYGIQHPGFQPTERINGCYLNVVGLPLCVLVELMAEFDVWPVLPGSAREGCPWSEKCLI